MGSADEGLGSVDGGRRATEPRLWTLAAWNGTSWIALAIYNFALSAIVFRRVSPGEFGVWATIVALRGVLLLIDGGLALGVSRDAALEGVDPRFRARTAAAQRLYLGLAAATTLLGLLAAGIPAWLLGMTGEIRDVATMVTALLAFETGITFIASPYAARLRGRQRSEMVALAAISQAVVGLALGLVLSDRFGLIGAGAAALAARVVWLAVLWVADRLLRLPLPEGLQRVGVRQIGRFAAPLWVIAAAGQLSSGTDVPIVGAIYGSATAGRYAVGALLPTAAVGLLFILLGAALPRFATNAGTRPGLGLRLAFLGSFLASLGFATVLLHADEILSVWLGEVSATSLAVMAVYSVARAINAPTHVVILMAVAAGRHSVLAAIAVAEALASFVLGLALALLVTPLGPAIGTLIAIAVSNLVVTPALVLPALALSWRRLALAVAGGYVLGVAAALPAAFLAWAISGTPLTQVIVACLAMVATAGAILLLLRRRWRDRQPLADGRGWL